ncbi:bifunctional diguanylate cyclase/phosphohydrolase [Pseudalkalibacillus sp. Hm43]|uniref:bifunctional diguanylate cyclase/phosphohydrolase n=1 Tax=Pseudalkalibacillus sp. Hm43 TaxID=3450742 RepID=UPI003F435E4F
MQVTKRIKPVNLYLTGIITTGILTASLTLWGSNLLQLPLDLLGIFTIALLLLTHNMILLPPKGNSLSMDSAVYLGCLLLFGLSTTIELLVITTIAYGLITTKNVAWWKHLFNLSNYSLMLFGANFTFQLFEGVHGAITPKNIFIYVIALSVYYLLNVFIIGGYFYLYSKDEFSGIYRSILEDSLFSYLIMLILSLVLVFLLKTNIYIGIILFSTITLLLSIAFKQYFNLYQQITEKANTDHLTGLYNHGYFKELLEEKVNESTRTGKPLSLAMLDLDDFKKYNDTFGHIQGDNLLKFIGELIKKECPHDIVARYGGEEYVVLMPNTPGHEAYQRMNRLRKKVNDSHYEGVEVLPFGCISYSGGVIEYENGTVQDFLQKADKAMYIAKSRGKNIIIPPSKMLEENKTSDEVFDEKLAILKQQIGIFLKKDLTTFRHSMQVYKYSKQMAERLNLTDIEREQLILGALIHDIGKVEIPRDMLTKTEKLTEYEWSTIKKHVVWGKEWIESIDGLQEIVPLVELHHERFDGKGYPYGLSGKSIPKLARILCIIDFFDAMTTERPYQATRTFEEAIEELRKCSGSQFDPEYVGPFIEMICEMYLTTEHAL